MLLISIIFFFVIGIAFNLNKDLIVELSNVPWNIWYLNDSFITYSLFQLGILIKKLNILEKYKNKYFALSVICFSFFVLLNTYNLNKQCIFMHFK